MRPGPRLQLGLGHGAQVRREHFADVAPDEVSRVQNRRVAARLQTDDGLHGSAGWRAPPFPPTSARFAPSGHSQSTAFPPAGRATTSSR